MLLKHSIMSIENMWNRSSIFVMQDLYDEYLSSYFEFFKNKHELKLYSPVLFQEVPFKIYTLFKI